MQTYFPEASRLIYGCMGLGGGWNDIAATNDDVKQAQSVIEKALELNINVFDHADIYTFGKAETVFGNVLRDSQRSKSRWFCNRSAPFDLRTIWVPNDMTFLRNGLAPLWKAFCLGFILNNLIFCYFTAQIH